MIGNALLFSIKPEYAKKIFDGTKTIELRRNLPKVNHGDLIFVYSSSPVKAVVGAFKVDKVICAAPRDLWNRVRKKAGISYDDYAVYFCGASMAYGIVFSDVWLLPEPLKLQKLKELWPDFRPPQSYRYINDMRNHSCLTLSE